MTATITTEPLSQEAAIVCAEIRLWETPVYSLLPGGWNRRMVAIGFPSGKRDGTTYVVHHAHDMISRPQWL